MFAVVRQYGVVVLETQKFYASLLLLILQLQMLSGALLKSRKLTLLQTTMVFNLVSKTFTFVVHNLFLIFISQGYIQKVNLFKFATFRTF